MVNLKNTGVHWLGEVAADWDIVPAWRIMRERSEKSKPDDIHLTPSQAYGVISQQEYMKLTGGKVTLNLTNPNNMKRVKAGDFVIHLRSFQGGIEASPKGGKVSNAYTVLTPTEDAHFGYYRWFMKSNPLIEGLATLTDQLRDGQSVNYSRFSRLSLPLPPLEKQRRIADYLDRETAEIDATVADLTKYVDLLQERRRIAIDESLADSSKNLVSLWYYSEINPTTDDFKNIKDGDRLAFVPLDAVWADSRSDLTRTIEWNGNVSSYTPFRRGDLLSPKVTPTVFHGRSMVADIPTRLGLATSEVHVLRARPNAEPRWLAYLLNSARFLDQARGAVFGVGGLQRISPGYVASYKVPLTGLDQQRRIADYLDGETAKIDVLIAESRKLRDLLLKRRSVLITDVVTGRKQV